MVSMCIFIVGCESKEEKEQKTIQAEQAKIQVEVNSLKEQVVVYVNKSDFENAIAIYGKILNLKEDAEVREQLRQVKLERDNVKKVKEYITTVKDLKYKLSTITNMTDLAKLLFDNKKVFDEFEKIDTSVINDISNFVITTLADISYKNFKSTYDQDSIKKAQLNASTSKTLDKISGGIKFGLMDLMVFDSIKEVLDLDLGMLENRELPSKYK